MWLPPSKSSELTRSKVHTAAGILPCAAEAISKSISGSVQGPGGQLGMPLHRVRSRSHRRPGDDRVITLYHRIQRCLWQHVCARPPHKLLATAFPALADPEVSARREAITTRLMSCLPL